MEPPRLMAGPPLHSVAHKVVSEDGPHWVCAEPVVTRRRPTAAQAASPNDFRFDMNPSRECHEVKALAAIHRAWPRAIARSAAQVMLIALHDGFNVTLRRHHTRSEER